MTETDEQDAGEPGGTVYDAPNQEVVGVGPPWTEGEGGEAGETSDTEPEPDPGAEAEAEGNPLDDMTKDELIAVASERGIDVNQAMTKSEIRAALDAG